MTPAPSTAPAIVAAADAALPPLLARTDSAADARLGDAYLDRRVADLVAHLHGWNVLLATWIEAVLRDEAPAAPAPGHSWADLGALNDALHAEHADTPYGEARDLLVASHAHACALLTRLDDLQLAGTDSHAWMEGRTLGDEAHATLARHYAWATGVLDEAGL